MNPQSSAASQVLLHIGNCVDVMMKMPDASFECCITSPPYFGLRDYGMDEQIGLEETPNEYVAKLVSVFREVHRLLCDDGVLWLNIGDSYARDAAKGQHKPGDPGKQNYVYERGNGRSAATVDLFSSGLKPKDLIGIPWRLALALQADGWYLRQDIIWQKPNAMPEPVKDRCGKSHEYLFLLSKSERYHFDAAAIAEPRADGKGTRNKRSVWSVPTKPYKGAHFAVFPAELIRPCVLAGCPAGGRILDPFAGSGTTGEVAASLDRQADLIELNPAYAKLAIERLGALATLAPPPVKPAVVAEKTARRGANATDA